MDNVSENQSRNRYDLAGNCITWVLRINAAEFFVFFCIAISFLLWQSPRYVSAQPNQIDSVPSAIDDALKIIENRIDIRAINVGRINNAPFNQCLAGCRVIVSDITKEYAFETKLRYDILVINNY